MAHASAGTMKIGDIVFYNYKNIIIPKHQWSDSRYEVFDFMRLYTSAVYFRDELHCKLNSKTAYKILKLKNIEFSLTFGNCHDIV